jgi:predicted RNA-binding Zn-ribbon protein involved in translation (DUF1610 family)
MTRSPRQVCPHTGCDGTLKATDEKRELHAGHHADVFECGECGKEVLRG